MHSFDGVGKYVDFSSIFNNSAVVTSLKMSYAAPQDGKIGLYINGVRHDFNFLRSDTFSEVTNTVNIPVGATVKFQFDSGDQWINLDYIEYFIHDENSQDDFSAIDLTSVEVNVASNQMTGTTTAMQYSLDSTNGTDGTWENASATTTPVTFVAGDVYVRQTALPSNFRKISTIVAAAAAPTVATIAQGTEDGTIKLTGLLNDVQYEYVVDSNPTLAGNAPAWSNAPAVTGTEIDNIAVAEGQYVHVRVKATANALASDVYNIQATSNNIRSFERDVDNILAMSLLQFTNVDTGAGQNVSIEYNGATLVWRQESGTATSVIDNGNIKFFGGSGQTAVLSVTVNKGTVTKSKTYDITIK